MTRRIAVLGGAGGIGRQLVAELGGEAEVIVLDLPASLERYVLPCENVPLDLHDEASVLRATEGLGPLDGFVNLAGYNIAQRPVAEMESAFFDDILSGNLRGAFLAARAVIPLMQDRPGASMVMISSGLAQFIRPQFGAYAMAKAGVIALTKTLALECAPKVRVNAVAPAAVDTAFLRGGTGRSDETGAVEMDMERYRGLTPLARIAEPADVSGPIRFLLGPDSRFMTGQVLWVNGGAYMP